MVLLFILSLFRAVRSKHRSTHSNQGVLDLAYEISKNTMRTGEISFKERVNIIEIRRQPANKSTSRLRKNTVIPPPRRLVVEKDEAHVAI